MSQNIKDDVMKKITSGEVTMKPKWQFIIGSVFLSLGLFLSINASILLSHITMLVIRQPGPQGLLKLQFVIERFSWVFVLILASASISLYLLRSYSFFYKKSVLFSIFIFFTIVIASSFLLSFTQFRNHFQERNPMRRMYYSIEKQSQEFTDFHPRNTRKNFLLNSELDKDLN
jgi:hypothetical protein